jgi:dipeptidyl aminopeptidase/acylaminoacyl peptidase
MKPTNYKQEKKYPLLEIHGGPMAMYQAKKACGMSTNIL